MISEGKTPTEIAEEYKHEYNGSSGTVYRVLGKWGLMEGREKKKKHETKTEKRAYSRKAKAEDDAISLVPVKFNSKVSGNTYEISGDSIIVGNSAGQVFELKKSVVKITSEELARINEVIGA